MGQDVRIDPSPDGVHIDGMVCWELKDMISMSVEHVLRVVAT